MCPSRKTLLVSAASLVLLLAAGSQSELLCQNVVANGQFDGDLSSWSRVSGIGFAHWDPLDAGGSTHSGSVLISNDSVPDGLDTSIDQCVSITGGVSLSFAADIHPDNYGQRPASGALKPLHTGFIYVLFNFYTSPSCGGAALNDFVALGAGVSNEWQSKSQNFTPAPLVRSVLVTLSIFKQQGGANLSAHFDNIFLAPVAGAPPTSTPVPASTDTPAPTLTPTPTATPTRTATPAATGIPTSVPTPQRLPRVVPFR